MACPASTQQILEVNARYHDGAAAGYDAKWGIDYGSAGRAQVLGKLTKTLGRAPAFESALELGAGTGYFGLHLLAAGAVQRLACTDISEGMIAALRANAERLGLDAKSTVCEAARLPFEDGSFDFVFGHAVLHHLPDLHGAFAEMYRVLAPGGTIAFAGEPSQRGHRLATLPKRAAGVAAPGWRRLVQAHPARIGANDGGADNHRLEAVVDVHTFTPEVLRAYAAEAGFTAIRIGGEELLANWFGWISRTLEASADPATVPLRWQRFAHRGYLLLQRLDRPLERVLPASGFYNLLVAGTKP